MAACDRAHHKELFGPWLIRQINNNSYGLSWKNPEKTIFCIPWKHLARKDLTGQDYELFKAWAIHGGKYSERPEDRSTWKTNFRCALNSVSVKEKKISCETQDGAAIKDKKLFTEVEDRSSDPHNPHKVYRLIQVPDGSNHASAPSAYHDGLPDSEEEEETLRISPDFLHIPNFKMARPQPDKAPIEDILEFLSLENRNAENVVLGQSVITNGHHEENGYHLEEAAPVTYDVTLPQQNGYHCLQQSTLQWCQAEGDAPMTDFHVYQQQQTWNPLPASCSQENKAMFNNQTIIQNGYAQGAPVGNGVDYTTGNSPVENSVQSWSPQWTTKPAVPAHSPIKNGFASPTAAFRQDSSPQHQVALFPIGKQHQDAATDATYNGHHGAQNGYLQEVPSGNGANYSRNCSPMENSYHSMGSQWGSPAIPEHQPTENGYSFQPGNAKQEHPPLAVPAQMQNLILNAPPISGLDVTIFYKGNEVHRQQVTKRCLLTFNPEDSSLGEVEAVHFPRPDSIRDQKQLEYTQRLLDSVQRGVLLEVNLEEKKLFATRLGKCKVFWAFSEELCMAERMESKMLQREIPESIFDFNTFWTELREYRQQTRRASPDYSLYLCFGQWLTEKPKEKKLILVKIVPKFCSFWHELIQGEGASSLNSETISLQISNGSSISLFDLLESYSLMDIDLTY